MSVEDTNKVDFVGIERDTNSVVLTITDHLGWEVEDHLETLQEK